MEAIGGSKRDGCSGSPVSAAKSSASKRSRESRGKRLSEQPNVVGDVVVARRLFRPIGLLGGSEKSDSPRRGTVHSYQLAYLPALPSTEQERLIRRLTP